MLLTEEKNNNQKTGLGGGLQVTGRVSFEILNTTG